MAETYDVVLSILVTKASTKESVVFEESLFNDQSFSRMANLADEHYQLIAKLQKVK